MSEQLLKVKITGCKNPLAWYANAVDQEVDCLFINDQGAAIISDKIVNKIDGSDEDACGHITHGEYVIVQQDNISIKP
jgi:hypothetical protein